MVTEEVQRFARLLESVVRVSKVSVRELERRLDLGGGTLNRIFSGKIDLKLRHILLVLEALNLEPEEFFRAAYRETKEEGGQRALVDQLFGALQIFSTKAGHVDLAGEDLSADELDRKIEAALNRYGIKPKAPRKRKTPAPAPPVEPKARTPKNPQ